MFDSEELDSVPFLLDDRAKSYKYTPVLFHRVLLKCTVVNYPAFTSPWASLILGYCRAVLGILAVTHSCL